MIRKLFLIFVLVIIPVIYFFAPINLSYSELEKRIKEIDNEFSGNLGVYIKDLGDGSEVNYKSDRLWYLASTIKIPIAIAVLQMVEDGKLSLEDKITLKESDKVDGAGEIIWHQEGTSYTIRELIERMLRDSDSIAADMLIRLMGVENFNDHVEEYIISDGIEYITTILQVRYDAYSELHEKASELTNLDIIKLKVTPIQERLNEFVKMTSADKSEIRANSIPEAFEKYYERNLNSAEPEAMGLMLEKLAIGDYLNKDHTDFLLEIMKNITTGDHRIKAGLPRGTVFAQKTGTQIARAVNMGIIYPKGDKEPVIVVACTEKFDELNEAESILQKIGSLVAENFLK